MNEPAVAEIQGLYGPVIISELLLQKIWRRQDFITEGLQTREGQPLKIIAPGNWNRLDGPDFLNAQLAIDHRQVSGDVEVHFYQKDWFAHGHEKNPRFDHVALHVVLFDPDPASPPARTASQILPATLVLLPWLHQDLEEYALEEAVSRFGQTDGMEAVLPLLRLPIGERQALLREKARVRWEQKRRFALSRLQKSGWEESCHQSCLEVLGYRRNRMPMSNLALRFPLRQMGTESKSAEFYYEQERGGWQLRGLRPANQPLRRLRQYLELITKKPDWPEKWRELGEKLWEKSEAASGGTAEFRRRHNLKKLRNQLAAEVLGGMAGGTRLDTLVCDALLPLLSAGTESDLFDHWFHWFAGDMPESLLNFLKIAQICDGRKHPASNGVNQGAWQILISEGHP